MNIAIIGHGPSMLLEKRASFIDSFDFVVRQKKRGIELMQEHPEFFGNKTNAVCGSVGQYRAINYPNTEKWVFIDSRYENANVSNLVGARVDKDLCNKWNQKFREKRTDYSPPDERIVSSKSSDSFGHRHLSSGFHTILYACKLLSPKSITLFGFDSLQNGDFTWSLTRGEQWKQYPDHRWDIEFLMIEEVKKHFGINMEFK
jgi:hypothetical protein